MLKKYIGRTIQLYPGDTYAKFGELVNVDDNGILLKITKVDRDERTYKVDNVYFISFSSRLTFKII